MTNVAYGEYSIVFSIIMFCNVILAFGMETAFFRFYNHHDDKQEVISNSIGFLSFTSIGFLILGLVTQGFWSQYLAVDPVVMKLVIWILVLDALVIIPFSKLRADERPRFYSAVKMGNVILNTVLNVFFLYFLPLWATHYPSALVNIIYVEDFQVPYIFIANLIASLATLSLFYKDYLKLRFRFNKVLAKQMLRYGFPIMIGGLAFAINESFDKILLGKLLPADIAMAEVGKYSACYKLGLFMVIFRQAYSLGIEPFFFNYAKHEDAPTKYATITKYFVISGSLVMLVVIVFLDLLKWVMIPNPSYWEAMKVVPLIILANFCLGIYTNLSVWYKLQDRTLVGAYISIFGAILTLVFNFLLIPSWGYMGSAVATLLAYGAMMVISYVLGARYYPIPYDKKAIGCYLGVSIGLSALYFYGFRENYGIGLLFIGVFGSLILMLERETWKGILKSRK